MPGRDQTFISSIFIGVSVFMLAVISGCSALIMLVYGGLWERAVTFLQGMDRASVPDANVIGLLLVVVEVIQLIWAVALLFIATGIFRDKTWANLSVAIVTIIYIVVQLFGAILGWVIGVGGLHALQIILVSSAVLIFLLLNRKFRRTS